MEESTIIIAATSLFGIIALILLYLITERKKKSARETMLTELTELLKTEVNNLESNLQTKMQEDTKQVSEKFELLAKVVRNAQDQSNAKINEGFEKLQFENSSLRKDLVEKIAELKSAFKEYSQNVSENLNKYNNDNLEFKRGTEQLKEQIQRELENILQEIKSPLDLD